MAHAGDVMAQQGTGMRLRPLAIGDVLDETFRLYRRHFVGFVLAMAVAVVPIALLVVVFSLVFGYGIQAGLMEPNLSVEQAIGMVIFAILLTIVGGIVYLLATIASVRLASDAILGRPVNVRDAYREAGRYSGAVMVSSLLSGLAVGLLVLTCLGIPFAVYLGVGWSVAMPAIVVERLAGMAGLRRSWDLVRGHRWRLILVFLLMGLITWLLTSLPGSLVSVLIVPLTLLAGDNPALMAASNVLSTLVNAAGQALFGGLGLITATVVYYDLLVRQEAFDLHQRAESLAEPSPPIVSDEL